MQTRLYTVHLLNSGLSAEVIKTILNSRAPITKELYAVKWIIFTSWCREHRLDTVNCLVASVMAFLQNNLFADLSLSMLKV